MVMLIYFVEGSDIFGTLVCRPNLFGCRKVIMWQVIIKWDLLIFITFLMHPVKLIIDLHKINQIKPNHCFFKQLCKISRILVAGDFVFDTPGKYFSPSLSSHTQTHIFRANWYIHHQARAKRGRRGRSPRVHDLCYKITFFSSKKLNI